MRFYREVLLVVLALACTVHIVHAQSTAFTYQGALSDENGPADGLFDMTFGLFTSDTGGDAVATVTNRSIEVAGGLFTTTLNFGAAVFDGTAYWLEIGVRTGGGGEFTQLSPRQALAPAPYAIRAASVPDSGLSGNVALLDSNARFTGEISATVFRGDGSGLTHISQLDAPDGDPRGAVRVNNLGEVGIGTADPQAKLHVVGPSVNTMLVESPEGMGTWLNLGNTSPGGRRWELISAGSGNSEGAGSLLIRDENADALRMMIDTEGRVGMGNTMPSETLEVAGRIVVADSSNGSPKAGAIRWTGRDFEGYNGIEWVSLTGNPLPTTTNMVWIEPGTFTMGSPDSEVDRDTDEGPLTRVRISRGFWMGKYEVTQGEYLDVIGSNPSEFQPPTYPEDLNRPVEGVSWEDATNYCGMLTERERSAGRISSGYEYRLPTEAEWEYACRAGTTTQFSYGDDPEYTDLGDYGWYADNSDSTTHPVGLKLPNPWGLYDMHGNVREWCGDWYADSYSGGAVSDPAGPETGSSRVIRGGHWNFVGGNCRSAFRAGRNPTGSNSFIGFRVVLAPVQ